MQGSLSTADPPLDSVSWLSCESPCDNCPLIAQCRDQHHACEQFRLFYKFGKTVWRRAPREPSAQIYRAVFRPVTGRPRKVPKTARRAKVKRAPRVMSVKAFMLTD
jgi:hypothetical protein